MRLSRLVLIAALSLTCGCSSSDGKMASIAGTIDENKPPTNAMGETSVRPSINAPYLDAELVVEHWVDRFERETREIYRFREAILAELPIDAGMAVADVGAGTGIFVPLLAQAVGEDGKVYAVDIVEEFLQRINALADDRGLTNVETVLCKEDSVALPEGSVDFVFVCDTYHHFEYPRSTMATIHTGLKPGGWLAIIDFVRVEGASSDWVMDHVRAGRAVFRAEIESDGFDFVPVDQPNGLSETYLMLFRKRAP